MRKTLAAALIAILAGLGAAAAPKLSPAIDERGLKALLGDRGASALLLDVRTAEEYAAGHIPGAELLPYDEIRSRFAEPDKARPIVVYCRSGRRSAIARSTLMEMGYRNVSDFGAVSRWSGKLATE